MTGRIGPSETGDAAGIVRVIRGGYSDAELDLLTYGCHGVDRFVEAVISQRDRSIDTTFTVARDELGDVVGCVELRRSPDATHLNYISVDPARRGEGLGRRLLHAALLAADATEGRITLDVLERNTAALGWYRRLGFEPSRTIGWWLVSRTESSAGDPGYVSGTAQADVCHAAFGFSQIVVVTSAGSHIIGRLGSRWFRITTNSALDDRDLLHTLTMLDGQRRLLAVLDDPAHPAGFGAHAECLQRSIHMTTSLETVLQRLAGAPYRADKAASA